MRCLVLGANGFIGRNLVEMILNKGNDELVLYDRNRIDYLESQIQMKEGKYRLVQGEFCVTTDFVFLTRGIDIVYHLVSTTLPSNSNNNIGAGIVENVVATSLLLDACVENNVKKVVFLSSGGTVYGITSYMPVNENSINTPISGYGLQKITIEKLLYLYWYMHGLDYRIIRLSNPYGKYQKPNGVQGVITTFVYKVLNDENLCVYGDGSVIRDYIYIDDAIIAIQKITNYKGKHKLFNVGSGNGYSINQIINVIERVLEKKVNVIYDNNRKSDVPINILDISRYKSCFGEVINVDLDEGIRRTYQYFKDIYIEG